MAPIRKQLLVLCLVTLLGSTSLLGATSAFSISKHRRSERNTDLAEALAILQRQRRRVGVEDFLNSQRMLQDRPLTLEDVSDWLNSRPRDNDDGDDDDDDVMMRNVGGDDEDSWMPHEMGRFKDFDLSDGGGGREVFMAPPDETPSPIRMKASENEVNDIFTTDADSDEGKLEKKVKEELVNPKGDAQSSGSSQTVFDTSNPRNVLNSLTDEEIRVLVKAVGKLQHQGGDEADGDTLKVKKSPEISELSVGSGGDDDVVISEPVSQEELKSVFEETDGPVSKETIIVEHKEPGQETPQVFGQEFVLEKLPDDSTIVRETDLTNLLPQVLEKEMEIEEAEEEESEAAAIEAAEQEAAEEEEVAAEVEEAEKLQRATEAAEAEEEEEEEEEEEAEDIGTERISPELLSKYLLMEQDNLPNDNIVDSISNEPGSIKRTAKRASGLYSGKEILSNEEIRSLVGDVDFKHLDTSSLIQAFVVKILSLQNEIDGLRFKNRLEDLENDELTDALNEATVGQKEGSVSNQEWSSLQHAIEIEQALQDLKNKETSSNVFDDGAVGDDDVMDGDNQEEYDTKRGEPWKRSQDDEDDDMYSGAIASRSSLQEFDDERNADIERLLKSSYLMKSDEPGVEDESPGDDNTDYMRGEEDEPIASLFLSHADRCPAIRLYSNNCELADLYNLPVDFEARALCNLHEMCYACGHSLSVTQTQCDLVYRAAVSSLCHQKDVCVAESEIFLRTMKLKTRFIPYVQPTCRSRCTAQFMGMF